MNFDLLFQPIQIGSLTVKNRFVMPAMESGTTEEGRFTERSKAYFAARARGGFGLIITDYMAVSPYGIGVKDEAGLWDDAFVPGLRELTRSVHENGAKIFAQLHHSGMMCQQKITGMPTKGPSAIASPGSLEPVIALTRAGIYELIEQYGDAALRARQAGFDGVEVHGAHGYLIAQFLSKFANKRSDEFGGSYENRFRFAGLIFENIRKKCGSDFPMTVRLSAEEFMETGNRIKDTVLYAQMAEAAGADAIHVSTGTGIGGNIAASYYFDPGFNAENAEKVKRAVSIPVITVGRITEPVIAASIVGNGQADLVALGRESLCDPEFPKKLWEGRAGEILHCTGCLQRCWYAKGSEPEDTGISCMFNPFTGKETSWTIEPTEKPKRIAVIGAGPAGLAAAWVLAKRGHTVDVYEKNDSPGGEFRLAAVPPHKQDLVYNMYAYTERLKRYGGSIHYNCEITEDALGELNADVILLSTGATPVRPRIPGLQENVSVTAADVLSGKAVFGGQKVLVLGGGLVGIEIAEFLSTYHNQVDVVDMISALAAESPKRVRTTLLSRLDDAGVKAYLNTKILEVCPDGILGEKNGERVELLGYNRLVLALGSRSNNALLEPAKAVCPEVYALGNAEKFGDARRAIYFATKLALSI